MRIRLFSLMLLVLTAALFTACGDSGIDNKTLAQIIMLEDQRNPDMKQFGPLLEEDNPVVRARACLALGRIGDLQRPDSYRSELIQMLEDEDPRVREMAAFALGEIEDKESIDRLIAALMDSDPLVRTASAEALSKIGNEQAAIALAKIIESDPVEHVRQRTLVSSFRLNDVRTARAAMNILKNGPSGLTWAAAYHFLRHRKAAEMDWTPELITKLAESVDSEIRKAAARFLIHLRDGETISSVLDSLLLDKDMYVQINALRVAGRMAYPGTIRVLLEFHETAAAQIRQEMANTATAMLRTMAENNMVESQEYQDVLLVLRNLVNDDNQAVASAAISGLAGLGKEEASLLSFDDIATDLRPFVRAAAVDILPYLDKAKHTEAVSTLLNDNSTLVQIAAATALQNDENKELAAEHMTRLLGNEDQVLVSIAATWFEHNGEIADLPIMIEAYKRFKDSPDPEAIQSILSAIARFAVDSEEAMAVLNEALDSKHYTVRLVTARLLADTRGEQVFEKVGSLENGRSLEWYQAALKELENYTGMIIKTDQGDITLEFYKEAAPLTCYNFISLAKENYFDDTMIHRVIPDFVAQMGDPRGDGWGGPGYSIRCEINQKYYETGAVGMAHAGKDTGGSQFFIGYSPLPHLDGRHTVFARVTEGMDVAQRLSNGSSLLTIELAEAK